jgi:hypothetical protein
MRIHLAPKLSRKTEVLLLREVCSVTCDEQLVGYSKQF